MYHILYFAKFLRIFSHAVSTSKYYSLNVNRCGSYTAYSMNALLLVSPVGPCTHQSAQEIITLGQINLPLGAVILLNYLI